MWSQKSAKSTLENLRTILGRGGRQPDEQVEEARQGSGQEAPGSTSQAKTEDTTKGKSKKDTWYFY